MVRWLKVATTRFRGFTRAGAVDRDIDEELRYHIELMTEENLRRGMGEEQARREALKAFGNMLRVKEAARDVRGGGVLDSIWQDVRYGARMLLKRPGLTLVMVLTLTLGIGANTAIFSLVYGVVLKPLPYAEPDRLVQIHSHSKDVESEMCSPADIADLQKESRSLEQITAYVHNNAICRRGEEQKRLAFTSVSPELFPLLGVKPLLGRSFTAEDVAQRDGPVTILGYRLWQDWFGGDPDVVGKTLTIGIEQHVVVGVMPEEFRFPELNGAHFWLPLITAPHSYKRDVRMCFALARLRPGFHLDQAQAELDAVAAALEQSFPDTNKGWGIRVSPLHQRVVGEYRERFLSLLGAVAFLLLIACANIASLFLARNAARQKEIAIRAALGASRRRLAQQMLTEGMIVAVAGAAAGLLMALWGLRSFVALLPEYIPRLDEVQINKHVLAFTLLATVITGLACGLAPALMFQVVNLSRSLKESGGGMFGGLGRQRLHNALVAGEVALALTLLIGAGLMLNSFARLTFEDKGFDPENVLSITMHASYEMYDEDEAEQITHSLGQLLQRVQALPGVESAALVTGHPAGGIYLITSFRARGEAKQPDSMPSQAYLRLISTDYFRTLKIQLLAGRFFGQAEASASQRVAIVNQALARRIDPEGKVIGRQIALDADSAASDVEIVGVVENFRLNRAGSMPMPEVYLPYQQDFVRWIQLVVRTLDDPAPHAAELNRQVREINKRFLVEDVAPLPMAIGNSYRMSRFSTFMLAGFATVALSLAGLGVFGVLSYTVSQRTREISIRMALGARKGDILNLILRRGLFLTLAGMAVGVAGAFALTQILKSQLYGVSPTDPMTFAGVSLLMIAIAVLACYLPARRATQVDPLVALREE